MCLFPCLASIFTWALTNQHRLWEVLWGVVFLRIISRLNILPKRREQQERINRGSQCQILVVFGSKPINAWLSLQWFGIPTLLIHPLEQPPYNSKAASCHTVRRLGHLHLIPVEGQDKHSRDFSATSTPPASSSSRDKAQTGGEMSAETKAEDGSPKHKRGRATACLVSVRGSWWVAGLLRYVFLVCDYSQVSACFLLPLGLLLSPLFPLYAEQESKADSNRS